VPNTLTQLNDFSDSAVVYNDERSYSIAFSANAAVNTETLIVEDQVFVVPTGIDITNVISQPGNITYQVFAGNAGNVIGSWPSPLPAGVSNTSSGNIFQITGTFSPETWTYAKNLTLVYPDKETNFFVNANLIYPNVSNTSSNNTWSWRNDVTITGTNPETLTLTTDYNWVEDNPTNFVYSIDDLDPTANFTVTFDQFSGTSGIITVNGVSAGLGNTATITGNRATVNAANVIFNPFPDASDNVQVYVSAEKTNPFGTFVFSNNVVANLNCTSSHDEFSLTTAYNYTEDQKTVLAFDITDVDPEITNYNVKIQQVSGNTGLFLLNGNSQGLGNSIVFSDSKANINAANVTFVPFPDTTSTVGLTYTQSKVKSLFGNIVQANNVAVTLTNTVSHAEFTLPPGGTYSEDRFLVFGNVVTDQDPEATSYTMSVQQTAGTAGRWYVDNFPKSPDANSYLSLDFSNSAANINSANIKFLPSVDATSNVTFSYNQSKVNNLFGPIVQADAVVAEYTCIPNGEITNMINRSYTSNAVNNIFSTSTPVLDDGDDLGQSYTITLASDLGKFGVGNIASINSQPFYTFTGNTTEVNNQFANMKFVPPADASASTGTFRYTQTRINQTSIGPTVNVLQVDSNLTLTGTTVAFSRQYEFLSDGSEYFPTEEEKYYGSNMRVIGVGAGAGGASRSVAPLYGWGGGAGQVRIQDWGKFSGTVVSFNLNPGGTGSDGDPSFPGTAGFSTVIIGSPGDFYLEAFGGNAQAGGSATVVTPSGTTTYTGGGSSSNNGGGGAGGGGNGGDATDEVVGTGGTGFTIPGTSFYVAEGGGGGGVSRLLGTTSSAPGSGGGGAGNGGQASNGVRGAAYIIWT
jgi:hypothetical protein